MIGTVANFYPAKGLEKLIETAEYFKNNEQEIASYLNLYKIDAQYRNSWNGNDFDLDIHASLITANNDTIKNIAEELENPSNLYKELQRVSKTLNNKPLI